MPLADPVAYNAYSKEWMRKKRESDPEFRERQAAASRAYYSPPGWPGGPGAGTIRRYCRSIPPRIPRPAEGYPPHATIPEERRHGLIARPRPDRAGPRRRRRRSPSRPRTSRSSRRGSARSWSSNCLSVPRPEEAEGRACGSTRGAALLEGGDAGPVDRPGQARRRAC